MIQIPPAPPALTHLSHNLLLALIATAYSGTCFLYATIQDASAHAITLHDTNTMIVGGFVNYHEANVPALFQFSKQGKAISSYGAQGVVSFNTLEGSFYTLRTNTENHIFAMGNSFSGSSQGLLMKISSTGARITEYGIDGCVTLLEGRGTELNDFAILPDGSIITIGTSIIDGTPHLYATKIDAAGHVNPVWGNNGFVAPLTSPSWGKSLHVLSDGTLILSGRIKSNELCAVKLTADGTVDTSYGSEGIVRIPVINGIRGGRSILNTNEELCIAAGRGKKLYVAHLSNTGTLLKLFSPSTVNDGVAPGAITRIDNALYINGVDSKTTFVLKLDMLSGSITKFFDVQSYLSSQTLLIFEGLTKSASLSLSAVHITAINSALYLSGTASNRAFILKMDSNLVPDATFGTHGFAFFPDVTMLEFSDKGIYRPIPYLCWNVAYEQSAPQFPGSVTSSEAFSTEHGPFNAMASAEIPSGQIILNSLDPNQLSTIIISVHTLDAINALSKLQQIRPGDIIRITDTHNTQAFIDCVVSTSTTTSNAVILSVRTWESAGSFSSDSPLCLEQFGPTPLRIQYLFSCKTSEQMFATYNAIPWTNIQFEANHDVCQGWTHNPNEATFVCPADGAYHIIYNARVAKANENSSDNATPGTPLVAFRATSNGMEIPGSRSALHVYDILVAKKPSGNTITSEIVHAHSHSNSFIAKLKQGDLITFQIRKDSEPSNAGNPGIKLSTTAGTSVDTTDNHAPSMTVTIVQIDQDL